MRTYPLSRRDRTPCCEEFRSAVAASLRGLPTDTLRRLACRWPRRGDPAERIVAEVIAKELLHRPARTFVANGAVSAARAPVAACRDPASGGGARPTAPHADPPEPASRPPAPLRHADIRKTVALATATTGSAPTWS